MNIARKAIFALAVALAVLGLGAGATPAGAAQTQPTTAQSTQEEYPYKFMAGDVGYTAALARQRVVHYIRRYEAQWKRTCVKDGAERVWDRGGNGTEEDWNRWAVEQDYKCKDGYKPKPRCADINWQATITGHGLFGSREMAVLRVFLPVCFDGERIVRRGDGSVSASGRNGFTASADNKSQSPSQDGGLADLPKGDPIGAKVDADVKIKGDTGGLTGITITGPHGIGGGAQWGNGVNGPEMNVGIRVDTFGCYTWPGANGMVQCL